MYGPLRPLGYVIRSWAFLACQKLRCWVSSEAGSPAGMLSAKSPCCSVSCVGIGSERITYHMRLLACEVQLAKMVIVFSVSMKLEVWANKPEYCMRIARGTAQRELFTAHNSLWVLGLETIYISLPKTFLMRKQKGHCVKRRARSVIEVLVGTASC